MSKAINNLYKLITAINTRGIDKKHTQSISVDIVTFNSFEGTDKELIKLLKKIQCETLKYLEKELKLVVKNHYRNMWMVLGMSMFGLPLGVVFGFSIGNMGFIDVGLSIGMVIGVGTKMDEQVKKQDRVLNIDC